MTAAAAWVEDGNAWYPYVTVMHKLGFSKVTIIARATYAPLACTDQSCVATLWQDTDAEGNKTDVNENQELLDEWSEYKKKTFAFYGKKYNIILRETNETGHQFIVTAKGNDICLAAQFASIWVVVFGQKKKSKVGQKLTKEEKAKKVPGFSGAQGAYNTIMKDSWDALSEAGV